MTRFLIGAAASAVALAIAPAVAQVATAPATQAHHAAKVHTRAEVQAKVATHFARMDANRDGYVTKAEAEAVRGQMRAMGAAKRSERKAHGPQMAFDRLDSNKDGAISRAEFDAAHAQRIARRDRDGDGQPDRKMRGMPGKGHGMAGMHGKMFETADANRDGRVSLQEATTAALQHFDMADANRDGQITREERMQMHQRMRQARTN